MAGKLECNYVKAVVICHGKSELIMARYVKSNLHLNILTKSRDNGKTSIQITSLMDYLNTAEFKTMNAFLKENLVEKEGKGKKTKLKNFVIFTIMDTDDCDEQTKKDYLNKNMFSNHWAKDYIIPIFNSPRLEITMQQCGLMPRMISTDQKGTYYASIFPINSKPLSNDTLLEIQTLAEKVRPCNSTNLEMFLDHCLKYVQI